MKAILAIRSFLTSNAGRATSLSIVTLIGLAGVTFLLLYGTRSSEGAATSRPPADGSVDGTRVVSDESTSTPAVHQIVTVDRHKLQSIGLESVIAERGPWPERLQVTGRLELNASRVAHVSSLVEGVIREVPVELGQMVEKGDVLAYIDSREVGEAKLQLVKDQLQLASAQRASEWFATIHENTTALLETLQEGQALDKVDAAFRNRPVGVYREQLVSALARLNRARADFERIRGLGASAVIPEKEVIRARAEHEAAAATYRALKEQIRFDAQQKALEAQQDFQAAEAAVAISRSHLLILGYGAEDLNSMDPIAEGERVAYYPLRSPISGTIIAKSAPLSQHVDEETELIQIADLSSVWLTADVFEKDLGAIRGLEGSPVTFEVNSYPGQQFTAEIFSLGDLVNDDTRAARLLAMADNSDRLLKPGMFVEIELTHGADAEVLQLPASAIQRHAGETFVFVSDSNGGFERRDVSIGRTTSQRVAIKAGLREGESVVVNGGFALKSEMLSELMVEE
jgi:cobalt-zinc-cadmium efflux system membrane fusion protein